MRKKGYNTPKKKKSLFQKLFSLCDNLIITWRKVFVNGFLKIRIKNERIPVGKNQPGGESLGVPENERLSFVKTEKSEAFLLFFEVPPIANSNFCFLLANFYKK